LEVLSAGALTGAAADPLRGQQLGQEQDAVLGHIEDGLIADRHDDAGLQYR
jgi:hypothetical protein